MTSTFAGPDQPPELLACHDPDEPWQRWGCPVKGCSHRVVLPWELEQHTAIEHPGWAAERMRVVFRLVEGGVGLPRFDGQGRWLGQAACAVTSLRVMDSNSSGVW